MNKEYLREVSLKVLKNFCLSFDIKYIEMLEVNIKNINNTDLYYFDSKPQEFTKCSRNAILHKNLNYVQKSIKVVSNDQSSLSHSLILSLFLLSLDIFFLFLLT